MIRVEVYEPQQEAIWNEFLRTAKNRHFLFDRRYMDYHSKRFSDHSLLFYDEGELVAILPANASGDLCISHQGLTFGGFIVQEASISTVRMLRVVEAALERLRADGFKRFVYKALPHIYHLRPAEEDIYALFRFGAQVNQVDVTTTINLQARGRVSSRRLRGVKKANKAGVAVRSSSEWRAFWPTLTQRLQERYAATPVHSADEIEMLAKRWPHNIKLHVATLAGEILAGLVVYETERVAHAQYISASKTGLELGALDALFETQIVSYASKMQFFDFGISTERAGHFLNEGLVSQKEGFGGSAIAHVTYALPL